MKIIENIFILIIFAKNTVCRLATIFATKINHTHNFLKSSNYNYLA